MVLLVSRAFLAADSRCCWKMPSPAHILNPRTRENYHHFRLFAFLTNPVGHYFDFWCPRRAIFWMAHNWRVSTIDRRAVWFLSISCFFVWLWCFWHQMHCLLGVCAAKTRMLWVHVQLFAGRMPFLSPNQQCQNTEWKMERQRKKRKHQQTTGQALLQYTV